MPPKPAPALADVLAGSARPEVRREAALALGSIGPAAATATPALSNALGDGEVSVVAGAAYALGRIGPEAKSAVPALEKCADSSDLLLRTISTWALAKIEPQNEARRLRCGVAVGGGAGEQAAAGSPRGGAGPGRPEACPRVGPSRHPRAPCGSPDTAVAANAVEALASLGEPAVPALIDALQNRENPSRRGQNSWPDGSAGEAGRAGPGGDRDPRRSRSGPLRGPDGLGGNWPRRRRVRAGGGRSACAGRKRTSAMRPAMPWGGWDRRPSPPSPNCGRSSATRTNPSPSRRPGRGPDRSRLGRDRTAVRALVDQGAGRFRASGPHGGGDLAGLLGAAGQGCGARAEERRFTTRTIRCGTRLRTY